MRSHCLPFVITVVAVAMTSCMSVDEDAPSKPDPVEKSRAPKDEGTPTADTQAPEPDTETAEDLSTSTPDTGPKIPIPEGTDTGTGASTVTVGVETDMDTETAPPPSLQCTIEVKDETEATVSDAGAIEVVGEPKETTLLFIFDKSGSMSSYWGDEMRWNAAARALVSAVTEAHAILADKLRVGSIMFPMPAGCTVEPLDSGYQLNFMPADQFLDSWDEAVITQGPDGSTPLGAALQAANVALVNECAAGRMDHLYKVVIITDGQPNCGASDSKTLGALPEEWAEHGITTYVFGLPGSTSAETLLNDVAEAGGSGSYYAPYQETVDGGVEERDADDVGDDIMIVIV